MSNHRDNYYRNRVYQDLGFAARSPEPTVPRHFKVVMGLIGVILLGNAFWTYLLQPYIQAVGG